MRHLGCGVALGATFRALLNSSVRPLARIVYDSHIYSDWRHQSRRGHLRCVQRHMAVRTSHHHAEAGSPLLFQLPVFISERLHPEVEPTSRLVLRWLAHRAHRSHVSGVSSVLDF